MTEIVLRRTAAIVLSAALLTGAACSKDKKGDATTTTTAPTTTSTAPTTTTAALTKEQIVLSADGVGAVKFGENSAHTIARFMQALGDPQKNTPLPAGTACGATRRMQWGNLQVLVNEVVSTSGAGRPGFAGWFLGSAGTPAFDFKTDKGITVGSTTAQMQAAYGPDLTISHGEQGQAFFIATPSGLQITGQLSAVGPAAKITNIQAGSYCGPG
jgi:hypothetical protein